MAKNDTFNLDDLIDIPDVANSFTRNLDLIEQTKELDIISNCEVSIDQLLEKNENVKKSVPPPPPPIPNLVNKNVENSDIEKEFKEKLLKNIIKEQDFQFEKNPNYTRVFLNDDDFDIKKQLAKIDNEMCQQQIQDVNDVAISPTVENVQIQKNNKKQIKKEGYKQVPGFVRFECFIAKFGLFFSFLMLALSASSFSLSSYAIYGVGGYSLWLYFPCALVSVFSILLFLLSFIKNIALKKELRNCNFVVSKENPMASITKIYRHLITANYYLNWSALSLYCLSGLSILMTFIVCFFINLADRSILNPYFGQLIINYTNTSPLIVVWTFASICFMMFFLQLFLNPLTIHRRNQIEVYYGKTLIAEDLIEKYRKSANRKGLAIFLTSTVISLIAVLMVYFILKRKVKKI